MLSSLCAALPVVHSPLLLDYVTPFPLSSHSRHLCPHSHSQQRTLLLSFLAKLEQSEENSTNSHDLIYPPPTICIHTLCLPPVAKDERRAPLYSRSFSSCAIKNT